MLKVSRILKSAIETRDELVQALGKIMNSDPRIQDLKRLNNRRVIDMYDEGPVDFGLLNVDQLIAKFGRGATYDEKYQSCTNQLKKMLDEFVPKAQEALQSTKSPGKHFFESAGDEEYPVEYFEEEFKEWVKEYVDNLLVGNSWSVDEVIDQLQSEYFKNEVISWMDTQLGDPHHDSDFSRALYNFMVIAQEEIRILSRKRRM